MEELNGQVALVTGGGRGLGEAICRVLARAGAIVIPADIRDDLAEGVAVAIRDEGGHAASLRLDVTDADGVEDAVRQLVSVHERLDILVNNAGVDVTVSVEELTVA